MDGACIRAELMILISLCVHPSCRRVWWMWSMAAGADVTWGILGELMRLLNFSPAELEGREALQWDMPARQRYGSPPAQTRIIARQGSERPPRRM